MYLIVVDLAGLLPKFGSVVIERNIKKKLQLRASFIIRKIERFNINKILFAEAHDIQSKQHKLKYKNRSETRSFGRVPNLQQSRSMICLL